VRWPCGGRPGVGARGGFLGGARSPRPHGKAELAARHSIPTTCVNEGPRPNGDMPRSSPSVFYWACGARPSGGRPSRAGMALRGRPGYNAEGGFLGGARSPRPHCEAVREPRHNMIIGGKGTPGGLMGRCPGKSEVSLAGVRSPPLRGGEPSTDGLAGKTRR